MEISGAFVVYAFNFLDVVVSCASLKKASTPYENRIQIGKTYHLNIEGYFHKYISPNGVRSISGLVVDSLTYLEFEDSFVRDFFLTKDLKGLCIIRQ